MSELVRSSRAAASRTFCTAGKSRPMRMAIIAITTSSSISVKAGRRGARTGRHMIHLRPKRGTGEHGAMEPPERRDYDRQIGRDSSTGEKALENRLLLRRLHECSREAEQILLFAAMRK